MVATAGATSEVGGAVWMGTMEDASGCEVGTDCWGAVVGAWSAGAEEPAASDDEAEDGGGTGASCPNVGTMLPALITQKAIETTRERAFFK